MSSWKSKSRNILWVLALTVICTSLLVAQSDAPTKPAAGPGAAAATGKAKAASPPDITCDYNDLTWSHGKDFNLLVTLGKGDAENKIFNNFDSASMIYRQDYTGDDAKSKRTRHALWAVSRVTKIATAEQNSRNTIAITLTAVSPHATGTNGAGSAPISDESSCSTYRW